MVVKVVGSGVIEGKVAVCSSRLQRQPMGLVGDGRPGNVECDLGWSGVAKAQGRGRGSNTVDYLIMNNVRARFSLFTMGFYS